MWTEESNEAVKKSHQVAHALTGTVPIPAAIPGVGLVLMGKTPPKSAAFGSPLTPGSHYIRVVEFPSHGVVVSRYFDAGDKGKTGSLRSLLIHKAGVDPDHSHGSALVKKLDDVREKLAIKGANLEELVENTAVAHVDESALLHVRVDYATTAAESFVEGPARFFCQKCNC